MIVLEKKERVRTIGGGIHRINRIKFSPPGDSHWVIVEGKGVTGGAYQWYQLGH